MGGGVVIVSAVAAVARNGVMGRQGKLPWVLPRDLKRFRVITWGKPIIMGRATHESLGRALPGRTNIVLTRQPDYNAEGCLVAHCRDEALALANAGGAEEAFVIGGSEVFKEFMPWCQRIHLTLVDGRFEGDVFFPVDLLSRPEWELVHEETWPPEPPDRPGARYQILERRRPGT
jgi:dihydrofolate reductase